MIEIFVVFKHNITEADFIKITLRHGCSPVNLLYISRTPFPNNTFGGLLLTLAILDRAL